MTREQKIQAQVELAQTLVTNKYNGKVDGRDIVITSSNTTMGEWVFHTGRLPGTEYLAVRRMTVWQMTDMIADLLRADIPMAETPEWVCRYVRNGI